LGHPLVGDELYGSKTQLTRISALGQRDFFLHAESLSFKHPFTNLSIFTTASLELDLLSDCF
ncbi:MAG: hypothetical protein KDD62_11095, partial [Bdellovibrionales bacterium]|nr:hypothetical protein [Bdellovibrionales bacterium]